MQGKAITICKIDFQATERKDRLDESYQLQRFLADFRDLISWVSDMKAIISADELAKDVTGAEALVDRHSEHKVCFPVFANGICPSKGNIHVVQGAYIIIIHIGHGPLMLTFL